MKRKINLSIPLILLMIVAQCFAMCACSRGSEGKTPQQLIEDAFGNKEFNISFSSETLDKPLEDMTYSANKIPKLPTPTKIGYIFEGWFLDSQFVVPYTDDMLYLSMKDLVLYPKWTKETFIHNGTYDIEFDAEIVEGTVKTGTATEKYGGYRNFCDAIIKDQCYIEKNDEELLLRFQYDCGITTPFEGVGVINDNYTVSLADTNITVSNSIISQADTVRTLFLNIDNWDLSDTLYLDISWTNYENPKVTDEIRKETTTTYRVGINLTKIIGFSQAFIDASVPLEEGYYLAKSYYRTENNLQSMGKTFNPVYSYIYSDGDGHYKLIKQNSPYVGLVENRLTPEINNYYDRMMTFTSAMMVYDIDEVGHTDKVESDYYPTTYNGGKYRPTTTEFHADTGKMYNIFDLDSDLTKEYVALTCVSGYMERNSGMGYIRQILSIDYNNLIKLPDIDYKPLEGDAYEFQSEYSFYPGNYDDLDQRNLTFDALTKFGFSIEMPNFFYSAPQKTAIMSQRTMHSSKFTVTPKKQTSGVSVSDSRYVLAEFDVNTKVFGYDVREGNNLYCDRMSPQTFEGANYNTQLRDVRQVKTGMSCDVGDIIEIERLFRDKVSNTTDFANVKYSAYEINDGKIDFTKSILIKDKKINFDRDIAVEFKYDEGLFENKTVVELKHIAPPKITVEPQWHLGDNGHYQKTKKDNVEDLVKYPVVSYKWGEVYNKFIDDFYLQSDGSVSINPSKCVIFANRDSRYRALILPNSHSDVFSIPDKDITLMYELVNEFGERQYISFDYTSGAKSTYIITDENGFVIDNQDVKYDKDGHRMGIYTEYTYGSVFDEFDESHIMNFTHRESGYTSPYKLYSYTVCSNNGNLLDQEPDTEENMLKVINGFLKDKSYGYVTFTYANSYGWLDINYLYKISYNGESTYEALNHDAYFTFTPYTFGKINLIGSNRQNLAQCSLTVSKFVDGRKVNNNDGSHYEYDDQGSQYRIIFKTPGTYRIELNYYINSAYLGESSEGRKHITFRQDIVVDSNMTDVEVTFVTDSRHPFKDGATTKTEKYSLVDGIFLLTGGKEVFDKNKFEDGREYDSLSMWSEISRPSNYYEQYKPGTLIKGEDFIDRYNSKHITLYAVWEISFRVDCIISDTNIQHVYGKLDYDGEEYSIRFPSIQDRWIPENSIFAGWTGGFLGSGIHEEAYARVPYRDDYYDTQKYKDYFTVRAVFKEYKNVKFDIPSDIAQPKRGRKVLEGELLENPDYFYEFDMIDSTKKFDGYYVTKDGVDIKVDLRTYVITEDVVFKAKFI